MFDKDYRKVIWQDIELINKFAEKNGYNRQVDIDRIIVQELSKFFFSKIRTQ